MELFGISSRAYTNATSKPNDFTTQNKETYKNIPNSMVSIISKARMVWSYFDESKEKDQQTRALIIWSKNNYEEHNQTWYRNEVMKEYINNYTEFKSDNQIRNHAIKMINGNNLQWKTFMEKTPEDLFEIVRKNLQQKTANITNTTNGDNNQNNAAQNRDNFTENIHVNTSPKPRYRYVKPMWGDENLQDLSNSGRNQ